MQANYLGVSVEQWSLFYYHTLEIREKSIRVSNIRIRLLLHKSQNYIETFFNDCHVNIESKHNYELE